MPNFPSIYLELQELWKRIRNLDEVSDQISEQLECLSKITDPSNSTLIACDLRISGSENPGLYVGPNATDSLIVPDAELVVVGRSGDAYISVTDTNARTVIGSTSGVGFVGTQTDDNFTIRQENDVIVTIKKQTGDDRIVTVSGSMEVTGSLNNGFGCEAIGNYSHAEGGLYISGSTSYYLTASGDYSHAEGGGTLASGNYSHAEGIRTISRNIGSHAEGFQTFAYGDYSHAEGILTFAHGNYSHAEGRISIASGTYSHAEGVSTKAYELGSHAEGSYTETYGVGSHAEGDSTISSGTYSHTEGKETFAVGTGSHAEGYRTTASADYSHAEGEETLANSIGSHAEGYRTEAGSSDPNLGLYAHAEGQATIAWGRASHAEGRNTYANNSYSHVEGHHTTSSANYQHVQGEYNQTSSTALMIIGNGSGPEPENRSNIVEVETGSVYIGGELQLKSNYGIKFGVINLLEPNIDSKTMDGYEEGTWTPVCTGINNVSSASGSYVKVGNLVHITGLLKTTSAITASVGDYITGFPYNPDKNNTLDSSPVLFTNHSRTSRSNITNGYLYGQLFGLDFVYRLYTAAFTSTDDIKFSCTYRTS